MWMPVENMTDSMIYDDLASYSILGFRNFDSCLRLFYTTLLQGGRLFRNLLEGPVTFRPLNLIVRPFRASRAQIGMTREFY